MTRQKDKEVFSEEIFALKATTETEEWRTRESGKINSETEMVKDLNQTGHGSSLKVYGVRL